MTGGRRPQTAERVFDRMTDTMEQSSPQSESPAQALPPRRRILVIAEAANPDWASVPLVGWSLANALRAEADVHIVTQVRNRAAIAAQGLVEGKDFSVIDTEWVEVPLRKVIGFLTGGIGQRGWTTAMALKRFSYIFFERAIWQKFGNDLRAGRYDIVHRVTPLSPTIPSGIARKCRAAGVPFMLGPINGGVPWPKGFDRERRREHEWLSYFRGLYKLFPGYRSTLRNCAAIVVGSRYTGSEIPGKWSDKVIYIPENAVDLRKFDNPPEKAPLQPLRACFIGRLVPYKGPDMLLDAAEPLLRDKRLTIDIVGDGPMAESLRAFVETRKLEEQVTFHGWVDHADVAKIAGRCALLTFPSIREFGGGVVLEAMAMGIVPLIVDYAGPGELVGDKNGFKVPIGPRDRIVEALRAKLTEITDAPGALEAIGHQGRADVEEKYTWAAKAKQIARVYEWVLGDNGTKPTFFDE